MMLQSEAPRDPIRPRFALLVLVTILTLPLTGIEPATGSELHLEVVLGEQMLYVHRGGETIARYTVAIGKIDHPTPDGDFVIEELLWNPGWVPPAREWARGKSAKRPGDPGNPMRVVKIPFDPPYYYIHGTDEPRSLGSLASHGCVRMSEADVEELGRLLMAHSGDIRGDAWFSRVLRERRTETVTLDTPVPLRIRMGDNDVYPGVVWVD
jgi:hypothetical protein